MLAVVLVEAVLMVETLRAMGARDIGVLGLAADGLYKGRVLDLVIPEELDGGV